MPLQFKPDDYPELSEMRWAGPALLDVVTGNTAIKALHSKLVSNHIRIRVLERARPGEMDRFVAQYEWLVTVPIGDEEVTLWADATTELPSADGPDEEQCIKLALGNIVGALMQRGVDSW